MPRDESLVAGSRRRSRRPHIAQRPALSRHTRLALSASGIVVVLAAWQLLSSNGTLNPLIYSSPSRIWTAFRSMVEDGSLWKPLLQSAKLFAVGLTVSVITGLVIGAVLGWYAKARAVFDPWVTMLYAMPGMALVPLLVVAFGSAFRTEVIVVWTVAVFPMIINVSAGVRATDRGHLLVARSYLATNRDVLWGVALPGAVPYVLAGVQQTLALSLVGVVVAEYFVSNNGLGGLILNSSQQLFTADAYVGMAIFSLAGLALTALLRRCERRIVKWR
jgi:ABC-type nitrate/sulfonate/bicarbonate transport system permease component